MTKTRGDYVFAVHAVSETKIARMLLIEDRHFEANGQLLGNPKRTVEWVGEHGALRLLYVPSLS